MSAKCRLAVFIPPKKKVKMKFPTRIVGVCAQANIEVVDIDVEADLYTKGPYDILVHKLNDFLTELEPTEGVLMKKRLHAYCSQWPRMIVIDDFNDAERLLDRFHQTNLMKSCEMSVNGHKVFVPKAVEISANLTLDGVKELIRMQGMKFPLLCKPALASGGSEAHDMRLVFTEERLCDLKLPCVVQEFRNHSGVVYKVYVVGEHFFMCEKPSIRDVDCHVPRHETMFFDTRDISKLGKPYDPNVHSEDPNRRNWFSCSEKPDMLNRNVIGELCRVVQEATKLLLLGIDVLVDSETGSYMLIDVNHFPGYSGINEERFQRAFVDMIISLAAVARETVAAAVAGTTTGLFYPLPTRQQPSDLALNQ